MTDGHAFDHPWVPGIERAHTTLELEVSDPRERSERSGAVRAAGRVVFAGGRVAVEEVTLHDGGRRLCATATSMLLVFDA